MSDPIPYRDGCAECARLQRQEQSAHEARHLSDEVDTRVMARRHLRTVHGVVCVVKS